MSHRIDEPDQLFTRFGCDRTFSQAEALGAIDIDGSTFQDAACLDRWYTEYLGQGRD